MTTDIRTDKNGEDCLEKAKYSTVVQPARFQVHPLAEQGGAFADVQMTSYYFGQGQGRQRRMWLVVTRTCSRDSGMVFSSDPLRSFYLK